MRVLYTIPIFLLICQFVHAQNKSSKAKIKSTIEYLYNVSQNTTPNHTKNWVYSIESHYDTAGRKIWAYEFGKSEKDNSHDTTRYIYNEEGRLLKMYNNHNVFSDYSYTRDKKGKWIVTDHHEKYTTVINIIDENASIDTTFIYDSYGGFMFKRVFKYNHDKTIYDITELTKEGSVRERSIMRYDNEHRMIDEVIIKDGTRQSHETIDRNKYGFTRTDSNKMYIGGPPGKQIADKTYSYTYKFEQPDKYDNAQITSLLVGDKYIVVGKTKYEYYK